MLDSFLQFGALGIVAMVVWFQMTRTDKLITNNTEVMSKAVLLMEQTKRVIRKCPQSRK